MQKQKRTSVKGAGSQRKGLLEGAVVGAVLGAVAGMLLAPESGKNMRSDIKRLSGDFYRYIAPRVKELKKMGEAEYNAFMAESAKNYAKVKKLSLAEEKMLAREAKRSWKHIKKNLQ
jgi:gas vesicle protein